ncbi:putative MATE family efflux protein [Clostridiales Family XIII bacterium PM5-7]
MKNETLMTSGTIWKKIVLFSIPLILGNLFQQLYNTIDSIIVGNVVGSTALAAVGSSGSIINLLHGFCIGASAGASIITSQFYGARDAEGVKKSVHTTVAISFWGGIILSVIGVVTTPYILKLMDTPEEVFEQAQTYLRIIFGGSVFVVVYNMTAAILNAVGNSKRSLVYLIISAVSNIILDILFVMVFKMGVSGAALATITSELISCIFVFLYMTKSTDLYKLTLKEIGFHGNLLSRIIGLGIPAGIQNIVISLSNVVVQGSINSFGATAMAAYAAYNKIDGFIILPILSLGMAATTFSGQNLGAGEYERVRQGMKASVGVGIIYTVIASVILLIFMPQVISIFTQDEEVVKCGIYIMNYLYPFYWILAIFHIMTGAIRGVGKTMEAMLISVVSLCAARIIWIVVAMSIEHRMDWIILSYPGSWLFGLILMVLYVWKGKWLTNGEHRK